MEHFYEKEQTENITIRKLTLMKYFSIAFFFMMFQIPTYAIDSLKLQLRLQELEVASDTQRLRLLDELSWMLRVSDNAKAQEFAEEGIGLASELNDSIRYYNLYSSLGIILAIQSEYGESIHLMNQSLEFFRKTKNEEREGVTLYRLGTIQNISGNRKKADSLYLLGIEICKKLKDEELHIDILMGRASNFYYWKKYEEAKKINIEALELNQNIDNEENTAKFLMNLGLLESEQGKYANALDYYLQASKKDYNNDLFKSKIFNNIGILYEKQRAFDKAIEYHQKSLTIKRKLGIKRYIANSLNNIGTVYKEKLDYGEALKYLKESLALKSKMEGTDNDFGETLCNIGNVLLELNKTEEAKTYYKRYLKLEEEADDRVGICRALGNLAETYRLSGEFQKALNYGLKSIKLAKEHHLPISRQEAVSESVSQSYEALGNYKQALFYKNRYWEIRDSTSGSEVANKIAELEIKYETEKKENELKLEKEQVKNLEQKGKIDQLKIGLLALGLFVLTLIAGFFIYLYRKSKSRLIRHKERTKLSLENITQENILLEQKNSEQQMQLNNYLRQLLAKSEQLQDLKNEIGQFQKTEKAAIDNINDLLQPILKSEIGLKEFKYYFTMVYKDFFKNLSKSHPKLTGNDLNLCALIKLNLSNKEIAQILNISSPSVKTARQRLYQKMDLADNDALRNYIIQL